MFSYHDHVVIIINIITVLNVCVKSIGNINNCKKFSITVSEASLNLKVVFECTKACAVDMMPVCVREPAVE